MKRCFKCKEEKVESEFCKNRSMPSGLNSYCKPCHKKINHARALKAEFGTTVEEYEQKFKDQNGVCSICKKPDLRGWRLSQDHDHVSGKPRGLLCMMCNTALGQFQDDPDILLEAIFYLKKWKEA